MLVFRLEELLFRRVDHGDQIAALSTISVYLFRLLAT